MYARVTTIQVDPARLSEISAKLKENSLAAKTLSGVIDIYAAWRADGQGTVVAIYNSKEDADAAAAKVQAMWGALAGLLKGAPNIDTYDNVEHVIG
jgi:hypothetical protein